MSVIPFGIIMPWLATDIGHLVSMVSYFGIIALSGVV
jgi:hypothetical protein